MNTTLLSPAQRAYEQRVQAERVLGVQRALTTDLITYLGYKPLTEELVCIGDIVLACMQAKGDDRMYCIVRDTETGLPTGEFILYTHSRNIASEHEDDGDEPADMWQDRYDQAYD